MTVNIYNEIKKIVSKASLSLLDILYLYKLDKTEDLSYFYGDIVIDNDLKIIRHGNSKNFEVATNSRKFKVSEYGYITALTSDGRDYDWCNQRDENEKVKTFIVPCVLDKVKRTLEFHINESLKRGLTEESDSTLKKDINISSIKTKILLKKTKKEINKDLSK